MKKDGTIKSISVTDLEGDSVNLIDLYHQENLLIIIYNNQCLGCTGRAIPLAYSFQQEFKDIRVLGIHSNFGTDKTSRDDIKSIFTIDELPFPIYLDEDHSVFDQFESQGTPQWLIIGKDGILFRSIFGSQEGSKNRLTYALNELTQALV